MANQSDRRKGDDDEYQFSEIGSGSSASGELYNSGARSSASIDGSALKRHVFSIVGVLILGFLIYKVLGIFAHKTRTQQTVHAAVVEKPAPPDASVHQLKTESFSMKKNLSVLENQVAELTTLLTGAVSQIKQQQQMITHLQQVVAHLTAEKKALPAKKIEHNPRYYIKAITQGRAWLIGADENNYVTVSVGSPLGDYGTIESIDFDRARVATSSGDVIQHNMNDR